MSNSISSSQTLISQEVENPSSFNFSIPPPDETPSTPVCGVGETSAIAASEFKRKGLGKGRGKVLNLKSLPLHLSLSDLVILSWNHLFEPPVPYLHEPKVHEFFYKMELLEGGRIATTVRNVETCLDEEILGIILGVHVEEIRTIEGCKPSSDFTKLATKRGDVKNAGLPKKFLKGEYQLMFEFINKLMVPRTEKRTMASDVDLFLMEKLDDIEERNLLAI
ncbi:hypothetical protein H5410_026298, partial [Solanum commersonii]